jgi:hypothetical protein
MLCLTRSTRHTAHLATAAALLGFMLAGSGCGQSSSTSVAPSSASGQPEGTVADEHAHDEHDHAGHDHADADASGAGQTEC